MSIFGERHAFSDVDKAGASDSAAAYLQGMADHFRPQRLGDLDVLDLRTPQEPYPRPYAGIRLARRLQTANASVTWFDVFFRQIPLQAWSEALGVADHLAALVASEDVTAERAQAFIDDLGSRDANGTLYAAASGARVLAVKPVATAASR